MEIETGNLTAQCEGLVTRINQIQADLKKVLQPSRPPFQKHPPLPLFEVIEKPNFFANIFVLAIVALAPSFIVMRLILEIENYSFLIIASVLFLIILGWNYSEKVEENKIKEKRNNIKNNQYNKALQDYEVYKTKEQLFQEELKSYQERVQSLNSLSNSLKEELGKVLQPLMQDTSVTLKLKYDLRSKFSSYIPEKYRFIPNYGEEYTPAFGIEISRKAQSYLSGITDKRKSKILDALREVQKVQQSSLDKSDKIRKIKEILWTNQSMRTRLAIGGLLGAVAGLTIFGTGGVGIAALGGAVGVWGWFLTSVGGAAVASIISNFENRR